MVSVANLAIYQGDDYAAVATIIDTDTGSAADLTGFVAHAQIRVGPVDTNPVVVVEILAAIQPDNTVLLTIPGATTALMSGRYAWDLELVASDGTVSTVLAGSVNVTPQVTQEPSMLKATLKPQRGLRATLAPGAPPAAPTAGGQTPWTQDIDAAGYNLDNAGSIAVGGPTSSGAQWNGPTIHLVDPNGVGTIFLGGMGDNAPGCLELDCGFFPTLFLDTTGRVGIGTGTSGIYSLSVGGPINCSGSISVDGTPIPTITVDEAADQLVIEVQKKDGSRVTARIPLATE